MVHPFRAAVEAADVSAAIDLMTADVVLDSPVAFRPYAGRSEVARVLGAVAEVLEDLRYTHEIGGDHEPHRALVFRARVGDQLLEGVDLLHHDADGRIDHLTVMVRPLSAALALAEATKQRLVQGTA